MYSHEPTTSYSEHNTGSDDAVKRGGAKGINSPILELLDTALGLTLGSLPLVQIRIHLQRSLQRLLRE